MNTNTTHNNTSAWYNDWVWVEDNNAIKFFNTKTRNLVNGKEFNALNKRFLPVTGYYKNKTAKTYVINNGLLDGADGVHYLPYTDEPIVTVNGKELVNSYNPANSDKTQPACQYTEKGKAAIEVVREHIRNVFGSEDRAVIFESWLAHQLQKPWTMINFAPAIQSKDKREREYFTLLLENIIGSDYVGYVSKKDLKSYFTEYAIGKRVNVVEDIGNHLHHELHCYTTDSPVNIYPKRKQRIWEQQDPYGYEMDNKTNYIALMDNQRMLKLIVGDRRWWVIHTADYSDYVGKDYFKNLYTLTEQYKDEIAKFYSEYEIIDSFRPYMDAPMSDEKLAIEDYLTKQGRTTWKW